MATKDISSLQVCRAVEKMHHQKTVLGKRHQVFVELLMMSTGEHRKVCEAAIKREIDNGLVEWGIVASIGWLTASGIDFLAKGN